MTTRSLAIAIDAALGHVADAINHADTDRCRSLAAMRKAYDVLVPARRIADRMSGTVHAAYAALAVVGRAADLMDAEARRTRETTDNLEPRIARLTGKRDAAE